MGKYEKAEPLYLEVMAIQEKKHGKEHPNYARCLDNLAIIEQSIGNYEIAEPLYLEALAIREKTLGKVNPMYANNLNNLALLYSETGKFEKAEPLHLEAKDIREKTLGKEHPDYATSVYNLAKHYQAAGEHQKAGAFFAEDVTAQRSLLSKAVRHLSEQEIGNYLSLYSGSRDELLAFAHSVPDESLRQKSTAVCFDNALFYKGFLLQAAAQVGRLALSDAAAAEKFDLLKSCESRLAAPIRSTNRRTRQHWNRRPRNPSQRPRKRPRSDGGGFWTSHSSSQLAGSSIRSPAWRSGDRICPFQVFGKRITRPRDVRRARLETGQ